MTDTYSGGYHKAVLDLLYFLDPQQDISRYCKSKKQYQCMVQSLLKRLAEDPNMRESFMKYGGNVCVKLSRCGEILKIFENIADLKEKK